MDFYEALSARAIPVNIEPSKTSYFSKPEVGLDPRLFRDGKLIPAVRNSVLTVLFNYLSSLYQGPNDWTFAWLAGSGVSHQWAAKRLPGDLDCLVGIDYEAFRIVCKSHVGQAIWGMVAHIVFEETDPACPSSISSTVIEKIIRARIGFDGLLLSDDLDMEALAAFGDVGERARLSIAAGCDVALQCSGNLADMQKVAESVPKISEKALKRLQKAADFPKMSA